jgi:transcriptional regulator with XRE-family HTH domain
MSIGSNILEIRKKRGMTSRELASSVGVTPATMSRYEHGKISSIPADMIRKISEVLEVMPEQLTEGDPDYSFISSSDNRKISSRKREEKELLRGFYGLSPELQDAVRRICNTGLSD